MNIKTLTLAAAFAAVPVLGFAQDKPIGAMGGASQDYMAAHKDMMKSMSGMKPTGDTDKDFANMMIPHHQGAIDMAKIQLEHGKDPELKKMAQKIIEDQEKEIAEFKKWLSQNK